MKQANVMQFINNYQKGSFCKVEIERAAKVNKSCQDSIVKRSKMVCRLGIDYEAMEQTQQFRESGKAPKENAGLKWGEWDNFPFTIKHKEQTYVRMYAGKGQIQTNWFKNGEPVSKKDIEHLLLSSEKSEIPEDKVQMTMTVKLDTIVSIE